MIIIINTIRNMSSRKSYTKRNSSSGISLRRLLRAKFTGYLTGGKGCAQTIVVSVKLKNQAQHRKKLRTGNKKLDPVTACHHHKSTFKHCYFDKDSHLSFSKIPRERVDSLGPQWLAPISWIQNRKSFSETKHKFIYM